MNTELWQTQRDAGVAKEDRVALLSARDEAAVFDDTGTPDWWGEANPSVWVYRKAIEDAHTAHARWRKGEAKFSRFAKKGVSTERCSFAGSDTRFDTAGMIRLPKVGWVEVAGAPPRFADLRRLLRRGRAKMMRVTVTAHPDGTFTVSGCYRVTPRTQPAHPNPSAPVLGADRGLKTACVAADSGGNEAAVLESGRRYRDTQRSIARWDRRMARRYQTGTPIEEQSGGYRHAKRKRAKLYARAAAQRNNDLHCYTKALVAHSPVICFDALSGPWLAANRTLAKTAADQGLGELLTQVTYKQTWSGGRVFIADKFFPSTSALFRVRHCETQTCPLPTRL